MNLRLRMLTSAALLAGLALPSSAAPETYAIDPVHSSVTFSIRHFVSKVPGKFTKFSGKITVDREQLENSSVEAAVETASLDTDNDKRDNHVRSADFLDAAKFPRMTFRSTTWKKTGENTFDVTGDLAIKDVTRPVTFKVTLLGFGPGMQGAQLSGWEASATINKKDFHVIDPPMLEAALGDEVTIMINVEASMKK